MAELKITTLELAGIVESRQLFPFKNLSGKKDGFEFDYELSDPINLIIKKIDSVRLKLLFEGYRDKKIIFKLLPLINIPLKETWFRKIMDVLIESNKDKIPDGISIDGNLIYIDPTSLLPSLDQNIEINSIKLQAGTYTLNFSIRE